MLNGIQYKYKIFNVLTDKLNCFFFLFIHTHSGCDVCNTKLGQGHVNHSVQSPFLLIKQNKWLGTEGTRCLSFESKNVSHFLFS